MILVRDVRVSPPIRRVQQQGYPHTRAGQRHPMPDANVSGTPGARQRFSRYSTESGRRPRRENGVLHPAGQPLARPRDHRQRAAVQRLEPEFDESAGLSR